MVPAASGTSVLGVPFMSRLLVPSCAVQYVLIQSTDPLVTVQPVMDSASGVPDHNVWKATPSGKAPSSKLPLFTPVDASAASGRPTAAVAARIALNRKRVMAPPLR